MYSSHLILASNSIFHTRTLLLGYIAWNCQSFRCCEGNYAKQNLWKQKKGYLIQKTEVSRSFIASQKM